jgi:hypothetical protein
MRRSISLAVPAVVFLFSIAVRADVIVSTSLSLTSLTITPAKGSVQLKSPFSASAFAQTQDSLGGSGQQFKTVNGGAASASASTSVTSATATASVPGLSASASGNVDIAEISAFAAATANGGPGSLMGSFEIVGTSGSVTVDFAASLKGDQSLLTNGGGESAKSEIVFSLLLPGVSSSPLLFYDNPLSIGPDSSTILPYSNKLTDAIMLKANTPYLLIGNVDSESSGLSKIPEPSLAVLAALALSALWFVRGRTA